LLVFVDKIPSIFVFVFVRLWMILYSNA